MAKTTTKKKLSTKLIEKTKSLADVITAIGVIGGGLLWAGGHIIKEINKDTNAKLDTIIEKVDLAEMDAVRSELLVLMNHYPDNESEIMKVAEYYFNELDGDWYMTGLFTKWAESRGIDPDTIVNVSK